MLGLAAIRSKLSEKQRQRTTQLEGGEGIDKQVVYKRMLASLVENKALQINSKPGAKLNKRVDLIEYCKGPSSADG